MKTIHLIRKQENFKSKIDGALNLIHVVLYLAQI